MTIEQLAKQHQIGVSGNLGPAISGRGMIAGEKVVLLQPTTFMNRSGDAVAFAMRKLQLQLPDLLVVSDDLDLPVGKLRLREAGSSGGHNGIKSIIAALGTQDFNRLRIGIGRPAVGDVIDYVLRRFTNDEKPVVEEAITRACDAIAAWVNLGPEQAASRFNG
jgi:PTH1 family peptidyl-tRNA hydrolase